jgi:hypothetical protein
VGALEGDGDACRKTGGSKLSEAVKGKLAMVGRDQGIPDLWRNAATQDWTGIVAVFEVEGKPPMGEVVMVPVAEYDALLERAEPPNTEKLLAILRALPEDAWTEDFDHGGYMIYTGNFRFDKDNGQFAFSWREPLGGYSTPRYLNSGHNETDLRDVHATLALAALDAAQIEPATGEEGSDHAD